MFFTRLFWHNYFLRHINEFYGRVPGISTLFSFVETLSTLGPIPDPVLPVERWFCSWSWPIIGTWPVDLGSGSFMLPITMTFSLATMRIICSWSSLRKREDAGPNWLEMSGKTLSAKSVERGILEPRKNTSGSCSTILIIPFAVNLSLSTGPSSCVGSWISCLTLGSVGFTSGIGSGNTYCFDSSFFGALGGIGIFVRRSERHVGFWSTCPKLRKPQLVV